MINSFDGSNRWLSNFWLESVFDKRTGLYYPSVENAYQANKFDDPAKHVQMQTLKPGQAKRAGHRPATPEWRVKSLEIMEDLLREKFKPGTLLAVRLMETKDEELIEGNSWGDRWYGRVFNDDGSLGDGENHLGKLLMKIERSCRG